MNQERSLTDRMTMVGLSGPHGKRRALGVITPRKKRRGTANLEEQNDVFYGRMRQWGIKKLEGLRLDIRVTITRIPSKSVTTGSLERRKDPLLGTEAYIVIIDEEFKATIEEKENKKEGLDWSQGKPSVKLRRREGSESKSDRSREPRNTNHTENQKPPYSMRRALPLRSLIQVYIGLETRVNLRKKSMRNERRTGKRQRRRY